MPSAQDLLNLARGEIGTTSGRKYWEAYWGGSWAYVDGGSTPWCACFTSWLLSESGVTCEGFPRAVAIDRRDGFSRQVEPSDLQPGDMVGYDWDGDTTGDHIGLFEEWVDGGWSFHAIEGNTSGGVVARKLRYVSQVTIGVRPDYDGSGGGTIAVDGAVGPATIKEWQRQMGMAVVDGIISGQLESEDSYRRNVWSVGHGGEGSSLVLAVQRRLRDAGLYDGIIDGCWGRATTNALQRQLRAWGYYKGGIDGDFGHHSAECLQRSLNDGRWAE